MSKVSQTKEEKKLEAKVDAKAKADVPAETEEPKVGFITRAYLKGKAWADKHRFGLGVAAGAAVGVGATTMLLKQKPSSSEVVIIDTNVTTESVDEVVSETESE